MRIDLQAITKKIASFVLLILPLALSGQTYNDGPIQLMMRLREVDVNHGDNDPIIGPITNVGGSELRIIPQGRDVANVDGLGWLPLVPVCLVQDNMSVPQISNDFNYTFFNTTYPTATVPQFLDLRIDAWEEDCPADLPPLVGQICGSNNFVFNPGPTACCNVGLNCAPWSLFGNPLGCTTYNWDDERCLSDPFITNINYRLNTSNGQPRPPCQWSDHGFLSNNVSCPGNRYETRIETFWRYTRGEDCANAILLGNIAPAFPLIQHFNSNECYVHNAPTTTPGNDVFYQVNVTSPVGITASLCGSTTWNTTMYILNSACVQIPGGFNDNACGQSSQLSVPLCTPGIYYIVVDGATAGDMGTFTLTIQENTALLPTVDAGNIPGGTCVGNPVTLGGSPTAVGGSGGYTYSWSSSPAGFTSSIANPIAGPTVNTTYTVTVTDAVTGCQVTDNIVVVVNPGPPVNLGPNQTVCPNTPVNLAVGLPNILAYFWSNGSNANNITVTQPGSYHVSVIDLFGCLGGDTVVIANYPMANVSLGADTSICNGASLTLNAGPGMTTYAWNPASGNVQTINVSTAGTYMVTITDGNACTRSDTVTVGINALPVITLGPDITVCTGEPAVLDPGPGFPLYTWSTGTNNQTESVIATGLYDVTVTDVNGCQGSDQVEVFNFPVPLVNITGNTNFCEDASSTLDAGAGWSSYLWNTANVTQQITVSFPGAFSVTITDANNCEGTATVNITTNPLPIVNLGLDTVLCNGANITLDAGNAGSTFAWSPAGAAQTLSVTASGTYSVTVTDGNNCQGSDDINVVVNPSLVVNLGNDTTICDMGMLMLDGGAGLQSYQWSDGSNNQWLFVNASGTYSVTVIDQYGCSGSDQITVATSSLISANLLGNDTTICFGANLLLDAGKDYILYQWNGGTQDQYLVVDSAGTYSVQVEDSLGCRFQDDIAVIVDTMPVLNLGSDQNICAGETATFDAGPGYSSYLWNTGATTQSITVDQVGTYIVNITYNDCNATDDVNLGDECSGDLFIPNVFTPNGDGINDLFNIVGTNVVTFQLNVLDRWGKLIYQASMLTDYWDGTFNGNPVPEGVYYYSVTFLLIGKEVDETREGNVTVIR